MRWSWRSQLASVPSEWKNLPARKSPRGNPHSTPSPRARPNLYKLLGVPSVASEMEIKQSYKKVGKKERLTADFDKLKVEIEDA